ncbi:hypothetical protein BH11ACT4_BH11ACT4_22410 [soil metagenome]
MIGALAIAVIAVVLAVAAALCASGVIPRNRVVGIRIASFFESADAWKTGHRVAVIPMGLAAGACVALTFVAAAVPAYDGSTAVIVSTVILVGGVVLGAVLGSFTLLRGRR